MTEGDTGVSSEIPAPIVPVEASIEVAPVEPTVETQAAASPPPVPAPTTEPPASPPPPEPEVSTPEVPPVETPQPEIPQPSEIASTAASHGPGPTAPAITSYLSRALEKIQFRKKAKLDKILLLAAKKRSIKNDDVEKLLRVSDATASRYLAQLVREGRLKRSGRTTETIYELG